MKLTKVQKRKRVHNRIRKTIYGSAARPRLAVFKSNKEIYCQLIDDLKEVTLAAASSLEKSVSGATRVEKSKAVGKLLADRAKAAGIETVVFDRGGFVYHGRVKALAEGARESGLKF